MLVLLPLLLLGSASSRSTLIPYHQRCDPTDGTIYDYQTKTLNGSHTVNFSDFKGQTVLFVVVATYWTYTAQYFDLNALHEEMKPYGFTILGFPCNNFGKQEPGSAHEILLGLKKEAKPDGYLHVRPGNGFVPNFQLMQKGDVNGKNEQKVFTFLKSSCPPVNDSFGDPAERLFWQPIKIHDIKWNFEKFLVGPDGKPVMRWHAAFPMNELRDQVQNYLLQLKNEKV